MCQQTPKRRYIHHNGYQDKWHGKTYYSGRHGDFVSSFRSLTVTVTVTVTVPTSNKNQKVFLREQYAQNCFPTDKKSARPYRGFFGY